MHPLEGNEGSNTDGKDSYQHLREAGPDCSRGAGGRGSRPSRGSSGWAGVRTDTGERHAADASAVRARIATGDGRVGLENNVGAVVQAGTTLGKLDDLDGGRLTIGQVQFRECFATDLRPAEDPSAGLVEAFDERDVEGGDGLAEAEIDICECPVMADVRLERTAGERPRGSVRGAILLGDTSAWPGPLGTVGGKRIASPVWLLQSEVCRGEGEECGQGNELGKHLGCDFELQQYSEGLIDFEFGLISENSIL